MLPEFPVGSCVLLSSIVLKRYNGDLLLRTLIKKLIFLYQRLAFKDSRPSTWYIFSVEDTLMAPQLLPMWRSTKVIPV